MFRFALSWLGLLLCTPGQGPTPLQTQVLRVTLRDAEDLAIRNNLALRAAVLDAEVESERIREALGVFDPTFFAEVNGGRNESLFAADFPAEPGNPNSPTVTNIISQTSDVAALNFGIRGLLETGLSYDLTFTSNYAFREQSTGFNPIFTSGTTLSFTQPLLRSAWSAYTLAPVQDARIRKLEVLESYRAAERDKLGEVHRAYYDLVFALADLEVKRSSVSLAEEQIAMTRQRVSSGSLAEIEITSAEAAAAARRADLVSAEAASISAEDSLRRLILGFDDESDFEVRIQPEEQLEPRFVTLPELGALTRIAERHRPELLRAHLAHARSLVLLEQRESESQARLDLTGRANLNSLGDHPVQAYRDAFSEDRGAATYSVGVTFEYPLGNRAARAREAQARISVKKAGVQLQEARTETVFQIRNALRNVEVARRSISARQEAERLAVEQLANERRRLESRRSTNFQVFQVEEDLNGRRTELIRTLIDYRLALLDLARVAGVPLGVLVP